MARHLSTVAVIGLGTTGSAIAGQLVGSGRRVIAVDTDPAAIDGARRRIGERGPGGIEFTGRLADAAEAELVVEAVPERAAVKRAVLGEAVALCGPDTVFVTTSGGLPVTELAFEAGCPDRLVGLHLFLPDGEAKELTVELVPTPLTVDTVFDDVRELVRGLGWHPVATADRAGLIGSALTLAYLNDAVAMHEQRYATRDSIDTAMSLGCGLRSGPLAQLDAIGLDTALDTLEALHARTGDRRFLPRPSLRQMVSAGLLGRKAGRGFYSWTDGSPSPDADGAAPRQGQAREVRSIGVVGSGTMAAGIAEVCARSGHPTVLVARSDERAGSARAAVDRSLSRGVQRGKLTADARGAAMDRLTCASDPQALAGCDLVVEAVAEDIDVKRRIFGELDRVCRPGAVLTTSTSSLPVVECARATGRPEDVAGMHFFNPAPVMKLIEVSHTVLTSPDVTATVHATARNLGKRTVGCRDRIGFIVNALLFPYLNHAVTLLQECRGTTADIDMIMSNGNVFPMGPFQLLDVVGLDVSLAIQRSLYGTFGEPWLEPAPRLEQLVAAGYTGRKSGKGFRTPARSTL
ncbi:3-hydroxyacyl-CoA dehydrogenase family protein [Streptomyces sp. VB1]|uniref:3-hydroxyacyl-CoA dehydrogenase family protein n=1 Tax=Streptomyces sp. VB1 TaxID=2986803 RepID=UPI0022425844|nr:3-hydroxyacyl-CoA dehydrogenase family protein [Streptomyces sp. VB1]UZI32623.1 3-hydroxyacyl-CoA dehydrogenase family protein [Streptomyces sp. VB1]